MPVAEAALAQYDLPGAALSFLRASENTVFRVTAGSGDPGCVLRVHQALAGTFAGVHRDPNEIRSELLWLEALARDTGLTLQQPVRNRSGALVTLVEGIPCTLLRWIEGAPFRPDDAHAPALAERVGEVAAALHEHGTAWVRPAGFVRPAYDEASLERSVASLADGLRRGLFAAEDYASIREAAGPIAAEMAALGRGPDVWGLIHSDLGYGNLLVCGERVSPIDFSLSGFGHFLFDVGNSLAALKPRLRRPFLAGYTRSRPLSPEHLRRADAFALWAVLNCFEFCLPDPAQEGWIRRRVPEVARIYCRDVLEGRSWLFPA